VAGGTVTMSTIGCSPNRNLGDTTRRRQAVSGERGNRVTLVRLAGGMVHYLAARETKHTEGSLWNVQHTAMRQPPRSILRASSTCLHSRPARGVLAEEVAQSGNPEARRCRFWCKGDATCARTCRRERAKPVAAQAAIHTIDESARLREMLAVSARTPGLARGRRTWAR
jgi:hypothetical protein